MKRLFIWVVCAGFALSGCQDEVIEPDEVPMFRATDSEDVDVEVEDIILSNADENSEE